MSTLAIQKERLQNYKWN